MVCSLCGGKHNLRTCPFPGAKKHRALLQAVNKEPGKAKTRHPWAKRPGEKERKVLYWTILALGRKKET